MCCSCSLGRIRSACMPPPVQHAAAPTPGAVKQCGGALTERALADPAGGCGPGRPRWRGSSASCALRCRLRTTRCPPAPGPGAPRRLDASSPPPAERRRGRAERGPAVGDRAGARDVVAAQLRTAPVPLPPRARHQAQGVAQGPLASPFSRILILVERSMTRCFSQIFLVHLPKHCNFKIAKPYQIVAVKLFDLYAQVPVRLSSLSLRSVSDRCHKTCASRSLIKRSLLSPRTRSKSTARSLPISRSSSRASAPHARSPRRWRSSSSPRRPRPPSRRTLPG